MKRLTQILFAAILAMGLSTATYAQTANDNITASASVTAQITVSGDQNIDYGTLNTSTTGPQAPTTAGYFTVDAAPGASIALSFSKSDLTTTASGTDQTLVINQPGTGTEDAAWEDGLSADFATASTSGTVFFMTNGANATLPADGTISVWANPTVEVDGTEVSGTYSGSVTLTATYN